MTSLVRQNTPTSRMSPQNFFRGFPFFGPSLWDDELSTEGTRAWMPSVDIRETEEAFMVTAELPGLTKDDVDITVENNMLRLHGERRWTDEDNRATYHRLERTYGKFTRAFTLPQTVRPEDVEARFENGVLFISIPKADEARPRKIAIQ